MISIMQLQLRRQVSCSYRHMQLLTQLLTQLLASQLGIQLASLHVEVAIANYFSMCSYLYIVGIYTHQSLKVVHAQLVVLQLVQLLLQYSQLAICTQLSTSKYQIYSYSCNTQRQVCSYLLLPLHPRTQQRGWWSVLLVWES